MESKPEIYFAASIQGSTEEEFQQALHSKIRTINTLLKQHGNVLNASVWEKELNSPKDELPNKKDVHDTAFKLVQQCQVLVAEVTQPSLGVGYEIGRAVEHKKNILCLFKTDSEKSLSGMIRGCDKIVVRDYRDIANDVASILADFFSKNTKQ